VSVIADTAALRKARGAFYTPLELARHVAEWAVQSPDDLVLEPSCGEAAFLLAAGERLSALNGAPPHPGQLTGIEMHAPSADEARGRMQLAGLPATVTPGDFFHYAPRACYDAVVGNPPYIRYQAFSGPARASSRAAALAQGVRLTGLASSWAAFTVHAALFLRPGGRLGLVLPAELLSVNYAAEVRSFLMRRFARVRLVLFEERVFPGVQEEVVLLLADGIGPTDRCELVQLRDASELASLPLGTYSWSPPDRGGKWTSALIGANGLARFRQVEASPEFAHLREWGRITLGAVSGNNGYFALSRERARQLGLDSSDLLPLSPPGSRHLRAATLSNVGWSRLADHGLAAFLFYPRLNPSRSARAYIALGESLGVHEAYKCRVRDPWWRVPLAPLADLFVTYMNAGTAQLATNRARIRHLNSVHGLVLNADHRHLGRDLLALASLNSMTLLGAEIVGRAYGGGLLKLEPREADVVPVPAPSVLAGPAGIRLRDLRPKLMRALRRGAVQDVVDAVDRVLLFEELGLGAEALGELRTARASLAGRRSARGRSRDGGPGLS
jgi:hypothetical protein